MRKDPRLMVWYARSVVQLGRGFNDEGRSPSPRRFDYWRGPYTSPEGRIYFVRRKIHSPEFMSLA